MVDGFFITGTDTGVGKSIVTASIVAALRMRGVEACGAKPIESGCIRDPASGVLLPADGEFLQRASGGMESIDMITPLRFESPLAPLAAAREEGAEVKVELALNAVRRLRENYTSVLVEGIGGLMVPVAEGYMVLDLARDIGMPMIVVASPFLGTINHTLLTVGRAKSEGIHIAGVILCQHREPENTLAERRNPEMLREALKDVSLLGTIEYLKDTELATLAKAAEDAINLDELFGI
jgi:dethiobiotin synthetase